MITEAGWIAGCLGMVVVDHVISAVRRANRRTKSAARNKLGNRFATYECLYGRHDRCSKGCGECGNPCQCECHGTGERHLVIAPGDVL